MNSLRSIVYVSIRGYARKAPHKFKNYKNQQELIDPPKENLYPDVNEFNYDPTEEHDDFNDEESDFMGVGRSYIEHMKEVAHSKELLKKRIVVRKYFKSNDPNFITWTEKEQIQSLHEKDSVEWTPERLSESFPALPETIRKILRAKWLAKSVETVIKHDQGVIDNWKSFRAGNVAVDPKLADHLKKFKDRRIEIANLTTIAERFVQKPPVFPTPKSKMFSNIIKGHIEDNPRTKQKDQLQIAAPKKKEMSLSVNVPASNKSTRLVTFDAFLKNHVEKVAGGANLSLENQLLVDEYKAQRSIAAFDNQDSTVAQCKVEEPSTAVTTVEPPTRKVSRIDMAKSNIDTGVLEWKKKESIDDEAYPNYIKVPKSKAESGVTFRVQDRYYDCDGEFLYRVPGLRP